MMLMLLVLLSPAFIWYNLSQINLVIDVLAIEDLDTWTAHLEKSKQNLALDTVYKQYCQTLA